MTRIDYEKERKRNLILNRLRRAMEGSEKTLGKAKSAALIDFNELLSSTKEISKTQKNMNAAISLLDESYMVYQKIACSCLLHLAVHHDIRVVRQMLDNMPQSFSREAMQKFLIRYGQIAIKTDLDESSIHFDKSKELKLGLALETKWWEC